MKYLYCKPEALIKQANVLLRQYPSQLHQYGVCFVLLWHIYHVLL